MLDEDGKPCTAELLNKLTINGQDYLLVSVDLGDDNCAIHAYKIVVNSSGEEDLESITDEAENELVTQAISELFDSI